MEIASTEVSKKGRELLWEPVKLEVPITAQFLRGPIPIKWLRRVTVLPGKCVHVALALWFLKGLTNKTTVKLSRSVCRIFHINKDAKYRALAVMEEVGLIKVERKKVLLRW